MTRGRWLLWVAVLAAPATFAGGELYGTVTTVGGESWTGTIRWDRNENFWDDLLDAHRAAPADERDDGFQLSLFGWKIARIGGRTTIHSRLSVPFGHVRAIESAWDGGATLTLKSGEVVDAAPGADLGDSMRELVLEDADGRRVELDWDDVARIDFAPGPGRGRDAERLYGTLETTGGSFTGFLCWDRDECLRGDVLDGEDTDGRTREIPFSGIRRIERVDRRSARVTLTDGTVAVLCGTNDVDDDNRGIDLNIPGLGRVQVDWERFRSMTFADAPPSPRYEDFDGGRRLSGTVNTVDGGSFAGTIVWDRDERFTWELLDGEREGIDHGVLFENIRAIRPVDDDGAEIELRDGRKLTLTGSNDVDDSNRGVTVRGPAGERELEWERIESVVFSGS